MTVLAVIQARVGSTRLPGKVLLPLAGAPALQRMIERVRGATSVDRIVVATSTSPVDDAVEALCDDLGITCVRGSESDVLSRFVAAAEAVTDASHVVRLTGDCPLIDPELVDAVVAMAVRGGFDYASNVDPPTWPDGLDVEVVTREVLLDAARHATVPSDREHVTPWIRRHARATTSGPRSDTDLSALRWTLDEPEDYEVIAAVYAGLYAGNDRFSTSDVLAFLAAHPQIAARNSQFERNEGYSRSLHADTPGGSAMTLSDRYRASGELLARAERTIPLGSQTFSKSRTSLPVGSSPLFAERGDGGRLWDVDGNEYVDLVAALACVTLGYRDPGVDEAVAQQLRSGVVFSLSHRLEAEVAERIVAMVPAAEQVRFGKNGSDATSAAIRLARAHTGRDRIAVCGYHGWHDWYIGSTARDLGVPGAVRELTDAFSYNDLDSLRALLERHPREYAAVIMEPMTGQWPAPGFLEGVRQVTGAAGTLLVFDETITGFRFSAGGAHGEFGVTPDLVTLGKGLANGFPLSAVAGRADLMALMTEIFFSGTFGGETVSLAAAAAVLDRIATTPVLDDLRSKGEDFQRRVAGQVASSGAGAFLTVGGHPTWHVLSWQDSPQHTQWELRTLFLQEMMRRGVLILSTHNLMAAHTGRDLDAVAAAYDEVLALLVEADRGGAVREALECDVLEPLFRVR